MKITALLDNINNFIEKKSTIDPEISNIEFDSRLVTPGTLFFALEGIHTDGHNYIDKAIELGAMAICHSKVLDSYKKNICYIRVSDTKKAMSKASAALYGFPSKKLKVIGVTGTDGKSTTVSLLDQFLNLLNKKSGYISTISYKSGDVEEKNVLRQSTPEASQIHRILGDMLANKKEYAIIESTSHGLSEKTSRLLDVEYNVGILTNITQEHLEFHGTLDQYRFDKGNLFRKIGNSTKENSFGVINLDDPVAQDFTKLCRDKKVYTYSLKNPKATLFAKNIELDDKGSSFTLVHGESELITRLNLPGLFNIENLMASMLAIYYLTSPDWETLVSLVPCLISVKGRLNRIQSNTKFSIMVDYAHTPGAFEKLLPSIRKSIKGRLITVFGSAGERDIEKRSIQGNLADKFADVIILTNEDPRLEDPLKIINDIKSGINNKTLNKDLFIIEDRTEAIKKSVEIAMDGDLILTLGKGHESSIVYKDGPSPWDEEQVIKDILKEKNLL